MRSENMAMTVEGALLGPPFQMLFDYAFRNPLEKGLSFKTKFKYIKKKIETLESLIHELEKSNMALDKSKSETKDFMEVLEKGKKLVDQCSKVNKLCYALVWPFYTTKLLKINESLNGLLTILPAQIAVDVKKIMAKLDAIETKIGRTETENYLVCNPVELKGSWEILEGPDFTVGMDKPLNELKMEILDGERSVIVVTAPGGCGKTTIVKKLCLDDEIKERYKSNIMFVKVSKTPNLDLIVQLLYQFNGLETPYFQGEESAWNLLEQLPLKIGQDPMLLVLDDVWSESESLVEKFSFNIPNSKILVTSRFAFPRFGPRYDLDALDHEDARTLFRHYAFTEDGSSNYITDPLVKKVVEHCKRIPLALVLIGKSLRNKPQQIWEREVKKWSKGTSILKTEGALLACLQSSIDVLDQEDGNLKECFMDLGLFPEDRRIPSTALIDLWSELYELEDGNSIASLIDLSYHSLANFVVTRKYLHEEDDYYSEFFVTQHDMLRELAIYQSGQLPEEQRERLIVELNGNNLPKWWKEHNDQPFNARLLAISTDGLFSSEWCDIKLPSAEVLVLNFQTKNHALPKFVKNMSKLKVLIITNYSFFPAKLSDLQLLNSLANLTRIRLERISIPSLKETSVILKQLQKLSLFMCEIGQAFSSIKISEVFPNLVEINIDYCNDLVELPAGLCDLINLKKLRITHCHNLSALPEEIGNLMSLEVLRLRSCIELENLPDSICKLSKLTFLDISDCFSIRNLPDHIGELRSLTKLNIKNCSRLPDLPPSVLDFEKLDVVCDEEQKELWESYLPSEANIELRMIKDDVNLNWLENHHS